MQPWEFKELLSNNVDFKVLFYCFPFCAIQAHRHNLMKSCAIKPNFATFAYCKYRYDVGDHMFVHS